MTTLDKQLRDLIVPHVKDIMELKFGCMIEDRTDLDTGKWVLINRIKNSDKVCVAREASGAGVGSVYDFEILGRPITLADVLVALPIVVEMNNAKDGSSNWAHIDFGGSKNIRWNLTQDLYGQSEETKQFLLELLSK